MVRLPVGRHPVVLTLAVLPGEKEPRPTHATLLVRDEIPVAWEAALRPGDDPSTLEPGEWFGYPVDSWHGAFLDAEADEAQNRYFASFHDPDALREEHRANDGLWNVHQYPGTKANVVTFFTGLGSGVYSSYFGRNARGQIVCLTTDFDVLNQPDQWP